MVGAQDQVAPIVLWRRGRDFKRLGAGDHFAILQRAVRTAGLPGSHSSSPTNLGGVDGLTGAGERDLVIASSGPYLQGISRGWRFKASTGVFAEITGRRPGVDSRRLKRSLVVFLGRERQSAGVLEDGKQVNSEEGTVQGGSVSPLLANIYLHYVLDLWAQLWRQRQTHGDVIIVRFADDFVVGFEHRQEAERLLAELRERLAKFGLELHPEKTRLIAFGRSADKLRRERGEGKPATFNFLGFTHICGKTRKGWFTVLRQTMRKRWQAKIQAVRAELKQRLHDPVPKVGAYLRSVVTGHYRYYGVPMNGRASPVRQPSCCRIWAWLRRWQTPGPPARTSGHAMPNGVMSS